MTCEILPANDEVVVEVLGAQGVQRLFYRREPHGFLRETNVSTPVGFMPTEDELRQARSAAWFALEDANYIVLPKVA